MKLLTLLFVAGLMIGTAPVATSHIPVPSCFPCDEEDPYGEPPPPAPPPAPPVPSCYPIC